MSGGVDSSVAAALLLERGYEVVGVTLNVWPREGQPSARDDACCALSAVDDARRVADLLGITHYTLNFRDIFSRTVIDNFVSEYLRGRTPNPCIRCNEQVKFGALIHRTCGVEADWVATGHYARVEFDAQTGRFVLRKARDPRKDQSYVLYVLTQDLLARTLMPLGELTKDETRQIARRLNLPTAAKAESQEICFVTDDDYARFVRDHAPGCERPGPIFDQSGELIGQHRGLSCYTIGQRRGLGLPGSRPRYVTAIDAERNAIVTGDERNLYAIGLIAEQVNLIRVGGLDTPLRVMARIRYRANDAPATITALADGRVCVRFDHEQRAITPGQAVVFYDGDLVLGGGTIASSLDYSQLRTFENTA